MADVHFRIPGLLNAAGTSSVDIVFVAIDNGDGTYSFTVDTGSEPAPTNYALEAGGHLATIDTSTAAVNTAVGAKGDTADIVGIGTTSLMARVRGSVQLLASILAQLAAGIGVTGTFWQATQPVSQASQPQALGAAHHVGSSITIAGGAGSLAARATRTGGYIRARKTNAANVVIDGTPLQPGDVLNLTAVDLYSMTGTNGDIVDSYEEYN